MITGKADIFCFEGDIYVHDGLALYRYKNSELTRVEGYIPLYGKDWLPNGKGEVNEAVNLLSDHIRISYSVTSPTEVFNLVIPAASIDGVEIDGVVSEPSNINARLDENNPATLHTNSISGGTTVTFWVTLAPGYAQSPRIKRTTKGFVFGNNGGERLCIYNPGISAILYSSQPIDIRSQPNSKLPYSETVPLYIPITSALYIGNGASPITEIAQHYGRGMLFTETDAWFIDWDGAEADESVLKPQSFLLNSAIGAERIYSSAYFDNDPITYFCGRFWRWHSQSGVRDECSATMISDEVTELMPKDSEKISMLSLPQKQKLFIADAEDAEGRVLVYDLAQKAWSVYSGIFADKLFRYGNLPAFSRGGNIYVFSDDLTADSDLDESFPIRSRLTTHFLGFGCPEKTKRKAYLLLECDLGGNSGVLTLENEKSEKVSFPLTGKAGGGREQFSARIPMPRFKKMRLSRKTSCCMW